MLRRRNVWLGVASALLAGLLVYVIYVVQLAQIRGQETVAIVVPKQFIDAGTRITGEMVDRRTIVRSALHHDMLLDVQDIVGKEAAIPLGVDEPVLKWKLNHLQLSPQYDEATFQIPREYIRSISSGIRAGDRVTVYVSGESVQERLFDEKIVVASVKTAAYTEVESRTQSALISRARGNEEMLYVARRDANAPIDHVNLNLTESQWLAIDRLCGTGEAKLVIAYTGETALSENVPNLAKEEGLRNER